MNSILTEQQIHEWSMLLARKIDDICGEPEATFTHSYNGLEAEIHRTADITIEASDICGSSWYSDNEVVEVTIRGIMKDYSEDDITQIEDRLTWMLN